MVCKDFWENLSAFTGKGPSVYGNYEVVLGGSQRDLWGHLGQGFESFLIETSELIKMVSSLAVSLMRTDFLVKFLVWYFPAGVRKS